MLISALTSSRKSVAAARRTPPLKSFRYPAASRATNPESVVAFRSLTGSAILWCSFLIIRSIRVGAVKQIPKTGAFGVKPFGIGGSSQLLRHRDKSVKYGQALSRAVKRQI